MGCGVFKQYVRLGRERLQPLLELIQRYPGVVALFGFVSGLASFFLVERHAGFAKVIATMTLLCWCWLVLENLLRDRLQRWFGFRLPSIALRYLTQLVHQESLFFVLPFFALTTSWSSPQAVFTGLLGLAALIALIDPLYYRGLAPRRWLYLSYHGLTLFAVLLVSLPLLLPLNTSQSYPLALGTAAFLSLPSLSGLLRWRRAWKWLLSLAMAALIVCAGWSLRAWVPPANLSLSEASISHSLNTATRTPGPELTHTSLAQLKQQGIYAYSSIRAPLGLHEQIYHVWLHKGREVERIPLQLQGGRQAGYRAWSHKMRFPAEALGTWRIEVQTAGGQMIGALEFDVVQ